MLCRRLSSWVSSAAPSIALLTSQTTRRKKSQKGNKNHTKMHRAGKKKNRSMIIPEHWLPSPSNATKPYQAVPNARKPTTDGQKEEETRKQADSEKEQVRICVIVFWAAQRNKAGAVSTQATNTNNSNLEPPTHPLRICNSNASNSQSLANTMHAMHPLFQTDHDF